MSISRTKSRKNAMTILYQIGLYDKNKISYNLEELVPEVTDNFTKKLVIGVIENQEKIDNLANKYLDNWNLARLGLTDQAIIRIAIYELLYTDTPKKVCIDEAVEISKSYSDEKVVKMINGILDKIYKNELGDTDE